MEAKNKTEVDNDGSLRQDEKKSSEVSTGYTTQGKLYHSLAGCATQDKSPDKTQNSFCRDAQELSEKGAESLDKLTTSECQDLVQEPGVHQAEPNIQNEELRRAQTELDEKLKAEIDERK
ncbi:MAG TPA: hypothetical protein VHT73_12355, partial [Thermodesulfobacteriota bacterium]|nr:hypothetical protein [Thermodesulfobacteriota bacterium]